MGDFEFIDVMDHIEVYRNGVFQFSADTEEEAINEIKQMEE